MPSPSAAVLGPDKMSDPFRMYEGARKLMYSAMERESDPPAARRGFEQALAGFNDFLVAASKNRGMYRELVSIRDCLLMCRCLRAPPAARHEAGCGRR